MAQRNERLVQVSGGSVGRGPEVASCQSAPVAAWWVAGAFMDWVFRKFFKKYTLWLLSTNRHQ